MHRGVTGVFLDPRHLGPVVFRPLCLGQGDLGTDMGTRVQPPGVACLEQRLDPVGKGEKRETCAQRLPRQGLEPDRLRGSHRVHIVQKIRRRAALRTRDQRSRLFEKADAAALLQRAIALDRGGGDLGPSGIGVQLAGDPRLIVMAGKHAVMAGFIRGFLGADQSDIDAHFGQVAGRRAAHQPGANHDHLELVCHVPLSPSVRATRYGSRRAGAQRAARAAGRKWAKRRVQNGKSGQIHRHLPLAVERCAITVRDVT